MKVSIYRDPCFGAVQILFWEERNGKRYVVEPLKMTLKECPDGFIYEPTLRINASSAGQFLTAFAEALDHEGVKTDSDAKIAGTLEATREHLKDLQKIVFKEEKSNENGTHVL